VSDGLLSRTLRPVAFKSAQTFKQQLQPTVSQASILAAELVAVEKKLAHITSLTRLQTVAAYSAEPRPFFE
jgi:hypothetical protein